ncbi:unnamed protein product [Paramecium sonneborni]|uniref:Uncharacterized protein n=1 Tax=Paramecium sonneborni TaxID=65129 RepID=A0A8S1RH11_9CILI|nr:unnamed protein product [Paramecium sonneborni]
MLGLKYDTYQYYSYKDLQQLKEILKYDSIGETKIYEDEKIIEYKINRSKCFLLSDLIELIKIGFVRFHLGQLLILFIMLLEKVKYMRNHNLKHKYLSLDRIWLIFKNNQYLTILYKKVDYQIAFTGYQNEFREDLSKTKCDDSKNILQIISSIIQYFANNNIVCNKKCSSKNDIFNNIYLVIYNSCKNQDIQQTIDIIDKLLLSNQFDPNFQTISFDDKIVDHYKYSKRKYQQLTIEKTLQQLILKYNQNPLVLDLFLFEKINEMRINLKNWKCLDLDEIQEEQKYQKVLLNYQQKNKIQEEQACSILTGLINQYVKIKYEIYFKFEMDQSYKQNIIDQIMELKITKYFENSKEVHKCVYADFYNKVLIDHATPIINECIVDYTESQILTLIDELI